MLKKMKIFNKKDTTTSIKTQLFIDQKRNSSVVRFISPGHPLYDNILEKEENSIRILAPNEEAFSEKSLTHIFAAIVTHNEQNYFVINTFKHFKEQGYGGLLQFDENIYNVIPFSETEDEYQTSYDYTFNEIYEYDHPVSAHLIMYKSLKNSGKLALNKGKTPLSITMIDDNRQNFEQKLNHDELDIIDFIIIPAIEAYNKLLDNLNLNAQ